MREILFKAKAKDTGKWVQGYIYKVGEKDFILTGLINETLIEVDPETVCQYTGLTDKNRKKIFEGDIIKDIDCGIMKCMYLHGSFVWLSINKFFWIELARYIPSEEFIGNIFDNPELLVED